MSAALEWPAPVGAEEGALYAEWQAKVRRHHGRSSRAGFAPIWAFERRVEAWVERQLSTLERMAPRPVVHVCSGSSRLGDVRVDLTQEAHVRGTAFQLP